MPTRWLAPLLQNCDSLFPSGAYAHSAGLEEMVRLGMVTNETTLLAFLEDQVVPALENLELPYVHAAYLAGQAGDLDVLREIAEEISAWKLCRESREASLQMGRGRLAAARKIFPHPLLEALGESSVPSHLIVIYGWQMAAVEIPAPVALSGFYYQAMAGFCSASLKLIRIGPEGAQRALAKTLEHSHEIVEAALSIPREDAGWFGPLLEIGTMRHERAEERLFIS
jgi:urease accessory protein